MAENEITSTTQSFLDVYDITNDMVLLKDGTVSIILQIGTMNFSLLAEQEQDAVIYTYGSLLNSLNFPFQINIQSQTKDATKYLQLLEDQVQKASSERKANLIKKYQIFVSQLIKERNVLEKKFYVIAPVTPGEMGIIAAKNILPGQTEFDIRSVEKSVILEKATTILEPRRDHLISQFARLGLFAKQLNTQEIIRNFYVNYNPEAIEGQEIGNSNSYTTPMVRASYSKNLMTSIQENSNPDYQDNDQENSNYQQQGSSLMTDTQQGLSQQTMQTTISDNTEQVVTNIEPNPNSQNQTQNNVVVPADESEKQATENNTAQTSTQGDVGFAQTTSEAATSNQPTTDQNLGSFQEATASMASTPTSNPTLTSEQGSLDTQAIKMIPSIDPIKDSGEVTNYSQEIVSQAATSNFNPPTASLPVNAPNIDNPASVDGISLVNAGEKNSLNTQQLTNNVEVMEAPANSTANLLNNQEAITETIAPAKQEEVDFTEEITPINPTPVNPNPNPGVISNQETSVTSSPAAQNQDQKNMAASQVVDLTATTAIPALDKKDQEENPVAEKPMAPVEL